MLTIVTILLAPFLFYFDKTRHKLFFFIVFLFLMCMGISYDTIDSQFNQKEVFENGKPKMGFEFWVIYFETLIAFFLFYIIIFKSEVNQDLHEEDQYDLNKLKKVFYLLTTLSLLAFCYNMIHVFRTLSLGAMILNPRLYEKVFGSSTLINYLYFLNIPALCLSTYLTFKNVKIKYKLLLNILLIAVSFFHGIKFTIFDTILLPALFLFIYKKQFSFKPIFIITIALISVYLLFNSLVRGNIQGYSSIDQVLSYVTPNFYNFFYSIEKTPEQFSFISNLLLPDKFPKLFSELTYEGTSGFVLNEKYNMQTILSDFYFAFSIFAPFLFLPFLMAALYFYRLANKNLLFHFITVFFIYCLLFSFFFYAFTKTKYLYFIFIFFVIHKYTLNKKIAII
jgi:oligosaccharide repeat unit polymerase